MTLPLILFSNLNRSVENDANSILSYALIAALPVNKEKGWFNQLLNPLTACGNIGKRRHCEQMVFCVERIEGLLLPCKQRAQMFRLMYSLLSHLNYLYLEDYSNPSPLVQFGLLTYNELNEVIGMGRCLQGKIMEEVRQQQRQLRLSPDDSKPIEMKMLFSTAHLRSDKVDERYNGFETLRSLYNEYKESCTHALDVRSLYSIGVEARWNMEQIKHFLAHKKFRPRVVKARNANKRPLAIIEDSLDEEPPVRRIAQVQVEDSREEMGEVSSMQSEESKAGDVDYDSFPPTGMHYVPDTDAPSKRQRVEIAPGQAVADEIEADVAELCAKMADDMDELKTWIQKMHNEESNPPPLTCLIKAWYLKRHVLNAQDQRIVRRYAELVPDFQFEG